MATHLLVFTDLDGTLLDFKTYSFEAALPALDALRKKNIPLTVCTSKTRAEIEEIRTRLQNTHPFIAENGGAVFIPKGYFSHDFPFTKKDSEYRIIELGTHYEEIRKVFERILDLFPGKLRGFGDCSAQDIARFCGFSMNQAKLAKQREYDEPFILKDTSDLDKIKKAAGDAKLQIIRGNRFYHLIGDNDKGKAVLILKDMYKRQFKHLKTMAIGDSPNDLPMFRVVDYPVLVQKPDKSYDPFINLNNLTLAPGIGPKGWNWAVMHYLNKLF